MATAKTWKFPLGKKDLKKYLESMDKVPPKMKEVIFKKAGIGPVRGDTIIFQVENDEVFFKFSSENSAERDFNGGTDIEHYLYLISADYQKFDGRKFTMTIDDFAVAFGMGK